MAQLVASEALVIRVAARKLEALRDLTDWEVDRLLTLARETRLHAGAVLTTQGERVTAESATAWFVIAGEVRVQRHGDDGALVANVTLGAGALIGVIALVLDTPRAATIVAESDARFLAIDRTAFDRMYDADSRLAIKFRMIVARQLARDLRRANDARTRRSS